MKLNLKLATVWFIAAASGGAIGGFGGVSLASWLTSAPKVLGADWWEVMTAFGTVGAAGFAGGSALLRVLSERKQRLRIKYFSLRPKSEEIYSLVADLASVYSSMIGVLNSRGGAEKDMAVVCMHHYGNFPSFSDLSSLELSTEDKKVLEINDAMEIDKLKKLIEMVKVNLSYLVLLKPDKDFYPLVSCMRRIDKASVEFGRVFTTLFPESGSGNVLLKDSASIFRNTLEVELKKHSTQFS